MVRAREAPFRFYFITHNLCAFCVLVIPGYMRSNKNEHEHEKLFAYYICAPGCCDVKSFACCSPHFTTGAYATPFECGKKKRKRELFFLFFSFFAFFLAHDLLIFSWIFFKMIFTTHQNGQESSATTIKAAPKHNNVQEYFTSVISYQKMGRLRETQPNILELNNFAVNFFFLLVSL